jgi:cytochrome P450
MVQLIEAELKVDRDAVIDLSDYGNRALLDVLGLAMMGYDFQTLQHPNNEFRNQFRKIALESNKVFKWMQLISHYIDLRPLLLIFSLIPGKKMQVKESSEFLRNFARKVIEQRREKLQRAESPDIKDITTVALESEAFQSDELADHAVLFLTVGHKSTSAAFEWTMFELGKRPEMQRRLRTDLNNTLGSASLGTVELGSRVLETPYLIAVCSEVIRCYPFTPLATKIAEIDTSLLGEHIPKGNAVLFSAEALNHDQELWGPDAHLFNPDRWMAAGMANSGGASSKYAMLSFSAGPWGCIGEYMARAELAYLVAAVVQRFEIDLVHPETGGRSKPGPFMRSVDEIQVRLKLVRSS